MNRYKKTMSLVLSGLFAASLPWGSADVVDIQSHAYAQVAVQQTTAGARYHQGTLQQTQQGLVQGYQEKQTLIWKGLRYAKAPLGELRWKAPQPPESWTGVMDATKQGNDGIQGTVGNMKGSEDCLNLSIWRPDSAEENLPVLVYIHGGNNQLGSSEEIAPEKLATKDNCIVVSLNYRLGLLGFNSLPALRHGSPQEASGNYSLLDIAQSLDWIKANIASFGGNPGNITISGFSAGGRDVMAMLISPIFEGKFQKAISFSGGMTTSDPNEAAQIEAQHLAAYVVEDGLQPDLKSAQQWLLQDNAEVRKYLYSLSAERLAAAFGNAGIRMKAFPHLYADGVVLPQDGFDTHKYNSVPLIMLTGTKEFSGFASGDPYFKDAVANRSVLKDASKKDEFAFAVKYGSKLYGLFNAEESAVRMLPHYNANIYTCAINWGNDPAIVGEEMSTLTGATHGIFIPFLTNWEYGLRTQYPAAFQNDGAKDLTNKFQSYIKNFLWNGNPNGKGLTKWEHWTNVKQGPSQLVFDATSKKANIKMTYTRTNYSDILAEIEKDNSIPAQAKKEIIRKVLNGRWFSKGLDKHFGNE